MTSYSEVKGRGFLSSPFFFGALIFGISFLLYAITVKFQFVWDDSLAINNQIVGVKGLSFFLGHGGYFRPFVTVFYLIDKAIWGNNPSGYHLTNVLLNSGVVTLLFVTLHRIFKSSKIAFISSLFFAIHPVHIESVAWVSGRTDLIASLFFIWGFLFYIKFKDNRNLAMLFLAGLMSLFSSFGKEIGVMFLFVIIFYDWFVEGNFERISVYTFLSIFLVIYVLFRYAGLFLESSKTAAAHGSVTQHNLISIQAIMTVLNALGYYVSKLIIPLNLTVFPILHFSILYFALGIIFTAVYMYFLYRKGMIGFSLNWFILTLAPVMILLFHKVAATVVAERYLYLPSASLSFIIAYMFVNLKGENTRKLLSIIFWGWIAIFATLFVFRLPDWQDDFHLWQSTVMTGNDFGDETLPYQWYGIGLMNKGMLDSAQKYFERAYRDSKSDLYLSASAHDLSVLYQKKGDIDSAFAWSDSSLKYGGDKIFRILSWRGNLFLWKYNRTRDTIYLDSAITYYNRALNISPKDLITILNKGLAFYFKGERDSSLACFQKVIVIDPERPEAQQAKDFINKHFSR